MKTNNEVLLDFEAEEKKKKDAEKYEKKQKELKKVYNELFSTENGKYILKDLMDKSGYFLSITNRCKDNLNKIDPLKLTYLDGRRSLFIEIINMIDFKILTNVLENGTR